MAEESKSLQDTLENKQVDYQCEFRSCPSLRESVRPFDCRSNKTNISTRSSQDIAKLEEQHRRREWNLKQEIRRARREADIARVALSNFQRPVNMRVQGVAVENEHVPVEDSNYLHTGAHAMNSAEPRFLINGNACEPSEQCGSVDKLTAILSELQLPKVELSFFDGNPVDYLKFTRLFEHHVEPKAKDPGQRMLQLLHYCRGKARAAIEDCILLPPKESYTRAKGILKDLFGQPYVVARSMISDLMDHARNLSHDAESLSRLAIKMQNVGIALEQLDYTADLNAMHTLEGIVKGLPPRLQLKWAEDAEASTSFGYEPTFSDLTEFVLRASKIANSRFGRIAEKSMSSQKHSSGPSPPPRDARREPFKNIFTIDSKMQPICRNCRDSHSLKDCPSFFKCTVDDRWSIAKRLGVCFSCLSDSHISSKCRIGTTCGQNGCQQKHHPLLHRSSGTTTLICALNNLSKPVASLGIIPVIVDTPKGAVRTLAFLDSGSNTSLVKRSFLDRYSIHGKATKITISTINGVSAFDCVKVSLDIWSLEGTGHVKVDEACSVEDIPVKPTKSICTEARQWPHLSDITFQEVEGDEVCILLGCDVPEAHWVEEQRLGNRKQPYATRTVLGWILCGPLINAKPSVNCMCAFEFKIFEQLQLLYENDFRDTSIENDSLSREDQLALSKVSTGYRFVDEHFEIPLPWRSDGLKLPNNLLIAKRRAVYLRQRLFRDEVLHQSYVKLMRHHLDMGYIERAPPEAKSSKRVWYMPHHPVFNLKKPEKLRIVFDCASKHNGMSLNDVLLQGPDVTSKLVDVLLRFRSYSVAVAADIEEMFLQVRVPEGDRDALRILWWSDENLEGDPVAYRMTVHPFGATSSPFCANYALRLCAGHFGDETSSNVRGALEKNFYVDDCLASLPDVQSAIEFVAGLSKLLSKGGFRLTKWLSNSREVLNHIQESERAQSVRDLCTTKLPLERTLGIQWNAERDEFTFDFQLEMRPFTRRGLLSTVASLYDPLGFVSPWLLPGKILLQELCRRKFGWDQPLEQTEHNQMLKWLESVKSLSQLRVPRCVNTTGVDKVADLHVFCDASEVGYGVAAYACMRANKTQDCHLVFSKARVTPLKAISIPRLELTAAVLAVRVSENLKRSEFVAFNDVFFWTDSTIVLYYVNNESSRFSTFVANRLTTIHDFTRPSQWRYVPTEDNPADRTSRGQYGAKRVSKWFSGPSFLTESLHTWPANPTSMDGNLNVELKRNAVSFNVVAVHNIWRGLWMSSSDWHKLLKSLVWLTGFKSYLLLLHGRRIDRAIKIGPITVNELRQAELDAIKLVQGEVFHNDIERLLRQVNAQASTVNRSCLQKLRPVLIDGILRVGGRLTNSQLPFNTKHPIILPRKHPVTSMIIRHFHLCEGHVGTSHLLTSLRQRYWILHGAAAVKEVIHSCMICKRQNLTMGRQLMASLPAARVELGWHPFSRCGLDYFGPFNVKQGRSLVKRYGCIFTCLQTRAVHIEVAQSMSTDSFMMALTRFIGRRGTPSDLYSDNGSNFLGAERELRIWISSLNQNKVNDQLLRRRIQWHFIPPYASHRGGSWERIIRSVRKILSCLLREQNTNDETLNTTMIEVERILNNRPLVPAGSDDPENLALTPNDLILLRKNVGLEPNDILLHRYQSRWKQAQYLSSVFWKRWMREYLPTLQARQRWISVSRNFEQGDVVLVASDTFPRDSWPLGIVVNCHHSNDGLVRTVDIKTRYGLIKRDIRRVCLLEGYDNQTDRFDNSICCDAGSPQVGGGSSGLPHREGPPGASRSAGAVPVENRDED